ncbi:hypothetical protein PILCRDRAFT_1215 [Piloderma croceum F 1598]|uniref:F-box domain-containing protein n=1 Tax=Piloderma croceum (strain F 1598) TaxID=765440 RepID=A0A0C3CMU2_PILCF|nr:hypothetical protein PILCRDRAFT_1215 [Piloderma croceum F 1598]
MHHCLKIPEILTIIFESLNNNDSESFRPYTDYQTFFALALVCRNFLEPALDALWREQGSFAQLIQTLPTDAWRVSGGVLSITRPLVASDWERFYFYAKRMTYVTVWLSDLRRPRLDPDVYPTIVLSHRPLPLLDNLRQLHCHGANIRMWNVTPFLGPKLTRFSMIFPRGTIAFETTSVLASLPIHTPSLQDLRIYGSTETSLPVCALVCALHDLHTLMLNRIPLTTECISHLSALSNLQKLHATITRDEPTQISSSIRQASFPSLTELFITVDTLTIATDFFEHFLRSSPLQTVKISIRDAPSSQHIHQCFSAMRRHCSMSAMKNISLVSHVDADIVVMDVLDPRAIRSLFSFSNLEVFKFINLISFRNIGNADIVGIARAWPHLRELSLHCLRCDAFQHLAAVTVDGLLPLANCASLKLLYIDLSAMVLDSDTLLRPGQGVSNTTLQTLLISPGPITNPFAVASFLSDVFPSLKHITGWEGEDDTDELIKWREAMSLYQHFVKIRMQEREWAARSGGSTQVT